MSMGPRRARLKRKKSTRRQSRLASIMICIAIVVVCLASVNKISELRAQSRELSYTEKALEQEIAQAKQETENLKAQENYMKTREYFEDQAKTKLGLVYPDEIVIKPAE